MNTVPPETRTGRVLLVDDDKLARLSLRTVIVRLNLEVLEAARADEALRILDENEGEIAIAVLDVKLAGTSGLDLLKDIKQRDPTIEAIMVTGFETLDAAKRALRFGACDFINKPFDVGALSTAIARAMKLHQSSRMALDREADLKYMLTEMGPQGIEWVRLLRGIVHDVRNMMCVVRSYHHHVDGLLNRNRQLDAGQTDEIKKHIGLVGRQLDTIVGVLDRQSRSWKSKGDLEDANIAAILDDLVMLIQRHPDAKRAEIELQTRSADIRAALSTSDAVEVLLNLLLNACQSATRGVRVQVEAEKISVAEVNPEDKRGYTYSRAVTTALPGAQDWIRIRIRDNGTGIPPEILVVAGKEEITTKGSRGSGIGLGVVAETITRIHGTFIIRTTPNSGSETELLLPALAG